MLISTKRIVVATAVAVVGLSAGGLARAAPAAHLTGLVQGAANAVQNVDYYRRPYWSSGGFYPAYRYSQYPSYGFPAYPDFDYVDPGAQYPSYDYPPHGYPGDYSQYPSYDDLAYPDYDYGPDQGYDEGQR